MKKSVIVGMICMFIIAGVLNLHAQQNRGQRDQQGKICKLTEEQKEQMKEVRTKYAKQTLNIKNELNELRAKQKTLISTEKPNKNEIFTNIDKVTALKKKLNIQKLDMKLEARSFLTEEQLLHANARPKHRKGMKQGRAGKQRMEQGRMHRKRTHAQIHEKKGMDIQKGMQAGKNRRNALELTEDQKDKMKKLHLAHIKDTKTLRDEAKELDLKQRNLMTNENPGKLVLIANINRLSDIQNSLEKKKFEHQMGIRKILDEDQLALFSRRGKSRSFHRGYGKW